MTYSYFFPFIEVDGWARAPVNQPPLLTRRFTYSRATSGIGMPEFKKLEDCNSIKVI